jgi:hypothetical protein
LIVKCISGLPSQVGLNLYYSEGYFICPKKIILIKNYC